MFSSRGAAGEDGGRGAGSAAAPEHLADERGHAGEAREAPLLGAPGEARRSCRTAGTGRRTRPGAGAGRAASPARRARAPPRRRAALAPRPPRRRPEAPRARASRRPYETPSPLPPWSSSFEAIRTVGVAQPRHSARREAAPNAREKCRFGRYSDSPAASRAHLSLGEALHAHEPSARGTAPARPLAESRAARRLPCRGHAKSPGPEPGRRPGPGNPPVSPRTPPNPLHVLNPLPHSLVAVVAPSVKDGRDRNPLDIRVKERIKIVGPFRECPVERLENPAGNLDVLLRHRPRSISRKVCAFSLISVRLSTQRHHHLVSLPTR